MTIRWSKQAIDDLSATAAYVAQTFGRQSAVNLRDSINDSIEKLAQFPQLGVVSFADEKTGVEFRELESRLNNIVYTIYNMKYTLSAFGATDNTATNFTPHYAVLQKKFFKAE